MQNLYVEGHEIASHTVTHPNGKDFSYNKWSAEVVGKFKYRASAIIYIFSTPFPKTISLFLRRIFQKILSLCIDLAGSVCADL